MPAMTDCEMLRRAVLLDPTDDLARLALADAMEEAGESEYGEFIRLQVALAAHGHGMDDAGLAPWPGYMMHSKRMKATERTKELLERNRKEWCAGVEGLTLDAWSLDQPILPYVYGMRCKFTRGFVSLVVSSLKMWNKYGPQVVARHPVEILVIHDRNPHVVSGQNRHSLGILRSRAGWYRTNGESDYCLPSVIWDRLECYAAKDAVWKSYNTEESAVYALGLAMLNLAREKADLPNLPWNQPCR